MYDPGQGPLQSVPRAEGCILAPLFTAWDLDTWACHPAKGLFTQAFSRRLQGHLTALKGQYPDLIVNPHSYGMNSLHRGGVMAAWHAGVDVEKIKPLPTADGAQTPSAPTCRPLAT